LLLVAFLLVNAPNCHLSLVLASVVQGDAVNCNTKFLFKYVNSVHCLFDGQIHHICLLFACWKAAEAVPMYCGNR